MQKVVKALVLISSASLVLAVGASSLANAGPGTAAERIAFRKARFMEVGRAAKALRDAVRNPQSDLTAARTAARQLAALSMQLPTWFPAGSGPGSGAKTQAKSEIWTDRVQFDQAAKAFAVQAALLDRLASSGSSASLASEGAKLAQTCKSCHQAFRNGD